MIPFIFHFPFWGGKWMDHYNVCLQSCLLRANAHQIIVYYDSPGHGPSWDSAQKIDKIQWVQTENTAEHRLSVLFDTGGFYCTLDMIFLKSWELLRHNKVVVASQCVQRKKIYNHVIGSIADSDFIAEYANAYDSTDMIPYDIVERHNVTLLKRNAFYPVAISSKVFYRGGLPNMLNSYSIHLWSTKNLTLAKLRKSGIGPEVEKILNPAKNITAIKITSGLCSFD